MRPMSAQVAISLAAFFAVSSSVVAAPRLLHSNGPLITSAAGGTGNILGQPLSKADNFPFNATLNSSTTGVGATVSQSSKVADDFYVPAGGWDLDAITVYAYQLPPNGATSFNQSIGTLKINLWAATPYTAGSPVQPPAGESIPQPLLAQPLSFDVTGKGTFVAHRVSGNSTNTIRPIYSYTVSADGLPDGGKLAAGHYWLEWSFEDVNTTHATVFVPLVSPREQAFNTNARQFIKIDSNPTYWFEGREGFGLAINPEGRPYALPFELVGTPEPTTLLLLGGVIPVLAARRRRAD